MVKKNRYGAACFTARQREALFTFTPDYIHGVHREGEVLIREIVDYGLCQFAGLFSFAIRLRHADTGSDKYVAELEERLYPVREFLLFELLCRQCKGNTPDAIFLKGIE